MRGRLALLSLGLAACGSTAAVDMGVDGAVDLGVVATDLGVDAPARVDAGFDAASLDPCELDGTTTWTLGADTPVSSGSLEEDRAFYVLSVVEQTSGVAASLASDTTLAPVAAAREAALRDAAAHCTDAACVRSDVVPSDADEASSVTATVSRLSADSTLATVATALRTSHDFERYVARGDDDATLVGEALTEALADLAAALDAYGIAELAPAALETVVQGVASAAPAGSLEWWQPLARVTLAALVADGRDEATRYQPLDTGENAAALAALRTTDFAHFAYAAILVPGQGPSDLTTMLDPAGRVRCDIAASRYAAGLAPFLLTSGGHVHPDRTPYSEAIEMKHYLMATYAIPESAILVDPYARHTTTNLRNATRVLLRGGAPPSSLLMIVTDVLQTATIAADTFGTRCDTELHFRPWREMAQLSPTDICLSLEPSSLQADAADPLDP